MKFPLSARNKWFLPPPRGRNPAGARSGSLGCSISLTGILAGISAVLSEAKLSLFAISTYNTDYILIKESTLTKSISVLENAGYEIKFL